jgi:hypothetical protein
LLRNRPALPVFREQQKWRSMTRKAVLGLFLSRRRFLSHRLLVDNAAIAEAGRITPLCAYPWIPAVNV